MCSCNRWALDEYGKVSERRDCVLYTFWPSAPARLQMTSEFDKWRCFHNKHPWGEYRLQRAGRPRSNWFKHWGPRFHLMHVQGWSGPQRRWLALSAPPCWQGLSTPSPPLKRQLHPGCRWLPVATRESSSTSSWKDSDWPLVSQQPHPANLFLWLIGSMWHGWTHPWSKGFGMTSVGPWW